MLARKVTRNWIENLNLILHIIRLGINAGFMKTIPRKRL